MTFIAGQITATGLVVAPLSGTSDAGLLGIIDYLTQQMNTIYGGTIDFTSNTPDGQMLNVFAQVVSDVLQFQVMINAGFDPSQAMGLILYQRGAINGVQIQGATYSTVNESITVSGPCTLYGVDQTANPVYTIEDALGNQWQMQTTTQVASAGTASYPMQSALPGAYSAAPNTITNPVTVVLQVTSVTNVNPAVPGSPQETDAAYKLRLQNSTAIGSVGFLPGLTAALQNISGISYANACENYTSSAAYDAVYNPYTISAHSIWCVVNPGNATDAEIANVIYVKHNAGCGIFINDSEGHNPVYYTIPAELTFVCSPANATAGAVYSNNGNLYTVLNGVAGGISLDCSFTGAGVPSASGTLTLVSGTGDATITFSEYEPGSAPFQLGWNTVIELTLFVLFNATSLDGINMPNLQALSTLGTFLTPNVGVGANINQATSVLSILDPNSLITFPGLNPSTPFTGDSGLQVESPVAGQYSAKIVASSLDQQLSISPGTVIATMVGVTQDFTGVDGSLSLPAQQLYVEGYGVLESNDPIVLSALESAIQVLSSQSHTINVYGGYFAGGSAATTLVQSSSGSPTATFTGMNPTVITYTAGSGTGYDVIKVEDSLGNLAYIAIEVV